MSRQFLNSMLSHRTRRTVIVFALVAALIALTAGATANEDAADQLPAGEWHVLIEDTSDEEIHVCVEGGRRSLVFLQADFPYGFDRDHLAIHSALELPLIAVIDDSGVALQLDDSPLREIQGCT